MKISYVILPLAAVILNLSACYLYKYIPEYQDKEDTPKKISRRLFFSYAAVTLVLSLVLTAFYLMIYQENPIMQNIKTLTVMSFLYPAAYYDYRFLKIPNHIIRYAMIIRLLELIPEAVMYKRGIFTMLADEMITAAVIFLICMVCNLLIKNAVGMGDIKLMIVMGIFLGSARLITAVLVSLIVAFFLAIFLLAANKKGKKDVIPFAPSVLAGTYFAALLMGI